MSFELCRLKIFGHGKQFTGQVLCFVIETACVQKLSDICLKTNQIY